METYNKRCDAGEGLGKEPLKIKTDADHLIRGRIRLSRGQGDGPGSGWSQLWTKPRSWVATGDSLTATKKEPFLPSGVN